MEAIMGKSLFSGLLILSLAVFGNGCASFVKHVSERVGAANTIVRINSMPQGAKGTLNTGRVFTAPANLVLRSDQDYTLTFTKEGYEPVIVNVESVLNPWAFGNIVFLPGFGCLADEEHGAVWTLCPTDIDVRFVEESVETPPEEDA